jgi:hypothetical protein
MNNHHGDLLPRVLSDIPVVFLLSWRLIMVACINTSAISAIMYDNASL